MKEDFIEEVACEQEFLRQRMGRRALGPRNWEGHRFRGGELGISVNCSCGWEHGWCLGCPGQWELIRNEADGSMRTEASIPYPSLSTRAGTMLELDIC